MPSGVAAVLAGAVLAACGDDGLLTDRVARVSVEPASVILRAPGGTVTFQAEVVDGAGRVVEGVPVSWRSSDESVAVVDATGRATALGQGIAVIFAEAAGLLGGATLAVAPDTLPPELETVVLSTNRVAVQNQAGELTVGVRFRDADAGVRSAIAQFSGPGEASITGVVTLELTGGDAHAGLWEGILVIPANTGIGTWRLSVIRAEDGVGNVGIWREAELEARGLAASFEVVWVK